MSVLQLPQAITYTNKKVDEMVDILQSTHNTILEFYTQNLQVRFQDGKFILINAKQNGFDTYNIRQTFIFKLLKWYGISYHNINQFSSETIMMMSNDTLKKISLSKNNQYVYIKIENNDAVSIFSTNYTPISNIEVLEIAKKRFNIEYIHKDDFSMRIYTEIKSKAEPVVGDVAGFGYNIVNSETGFTKLQVEHYILRYWCSNGATTKIKGNSISVTHYNKNRQFILNDFNNSLANIESIDERYYQNVQKAIEEPSIYSFPFISYRVNSIIGNYKGSYYFKDFQEEKQNKYDLYNHITHKAKSFNLLEKYQLEQLGGSLIM